MATRTLSRVEGTGQDWIAEGYVVIEIQLGTRINGSENTEWRCAHCDSIVLHGLDRPNAIVPKPPAKLLLQCHCGGLSDLNATGDPRLN